MFCALSAIATLVLEFPLIPGVSFLKYDPSAAIALVAGLLYGWQMGFLVAVLPNVLHLASQSGFYGMVMAVLASVSFVLPTVLIARRISGLKGMVIGAVVGGIITLGACIGGNLIITPVYTGMSIDAVMKLIPFALLPFNALKALINAVLGIVLAQNLKPILGRGDVRS